MKTLSAQNETLRKQLIVELYERIDYYVNNPSNNLLAEHEQIEGVINKIIEVEKEISVELPQRENKWDDFKVWCTKNAVPIEKFEIKKTNGNEYGLFSKSNINVNDIIMEIPRKSFLTNETALADNKIVQFLQDVIFQHMPNLILAFHLMSEYSKANSFWGPYLKILPNQYSTILYLSHEELKQLQGSPLLEEVIKIKRNAARQYAYFWMKLQSERNKNMFGQYSYELYRWALSTVMTRQNSIPCKSDKKKSTFALIPLWDLCNHKEGQLCTDFNTIKDCLVFYAMDDFKKGVEIFNYYGDRSNADFFVHNGFVYPNHSNDAVRVKIGISKADPMFKLKDALCKKIELCTHGSYDIQHRSKQLNPKILAIVRVFFLGKEELEKWIASNKAMDIYEEECAELNHLTPKIKEFLAMRCSLLLKRYPTIADFHNQNIKKIVECEKEILKSFQI